MLLLFYLGGLNRIDIFISTMMAYMRTDDKDLLLDDLITLYNLQELGDNEEEDDTRSGSAQGYYYYYYQYMNTQSGERSTGAGGAPRWSGWRYFAQTERF